MQTSEVTLRTEGNLPPPTIMAPKNVAKPNWTTKKRAFCMEYLKDFNATQAAIRAGFSKRSAGTHGTALMKDPTIASYLAQAVSVRLQALDSDSNALMRELSRLAHVNTKAAFRPDGSLLPLDEMHDDVARCIAGLETEEIWETRYDESGQEKGPVLVRTVIRKIKFWDKNKAADTLAKCMKLFSNGSNVTVNLSLEALVMQSIPAVAIPTAAAPQVQSPSAHAVIDVTPQAAASAPGAPDGQQAGLVESSAEQP